MNRQHQQIYRLTLTAILVALATCGGSLFSFPVGAAKVAPVQHFINVLSGILLGPYWALLQAFLTSLLRNLLETGTILAFPGSMIGAFLSGWLYQRTKQIWTGVASEIVGTGIIGAICAQPIAALFMGTKGALWIFVPSFFLSTLVGSLVAYVLLKAAWPIVTRYLSKPKEE